MPSEHLPVLYIVAFVVYPFATLGLCAFIASKTNRTRFVPHFAVLGALAGLFVCAWFIASIGGWGKIPPVTFIGSLVLTFGTAATGALLATICNIFWPCRSHDNELTS